MEIIETIDNPLVPYDLLFQADEDDAKIAVYRNTAVFWAARVDDDIVGILGLLELNSGVAEIVNVSVRETFRRRGLATRLIEAAIAYARETGYRDLFIRTGDCGIWQISLYQRCGFRMDSIRKEYFLREYKVPIYENNIRCVNQVTLKYRIYTEAELRQELSGYWTRFIERHPEYTGRSHQIWHFGYGEYLPDKLLGLVKLGKKTATSSALEMYTGEDEKVPEVGDLSIITYGNGLPGCIIETREIRKKKFREITGEDAALEGEGDLSLAYWRQAHEWFFRLEYRDNHREFSEEIPVIFERFAVVYDEDRK